MKRYLLILALSVLLLAGLNLRNRTVIATSADFPIAEQTALSQQDDSHRADIARQANSLFAPPSSMRTVAQNDNNEQSSHPQTLATIIFTPQSESETVSEPIPHDNLFQIACGGTFDRVSDYYVYALRRIII
jgi:hypothetical protein